MPSATPAILRLLSVALAAAVVIEVLLLRILARAGIYMFTETSPAFARAIYSGFVFAGEVALNLAIIVAPAVLLLIILQLGSERSPLLRILAVPLAVTLVAAALLQFGFNAGPITATLLLASLAGLVLTALLAGSQATTPARVTLALLAATGSLAIIAKLLPQFSGPGAAPPDISAELLLVSEALLVLSPIPLVLLRRTVHRRAAGIAVAAAGLALLAGLLGADMLPLISTFAFGFTVSLPYLFYIVGAGFIVYVLAALAFRREWAIVVPLLLILLGHRGLSLTYFDVLLLVGFVLLGLEFARRGSALPGRGGSLHVGAVAL